MLRLPGRSTRPMSRDRGAVAGVARFASAATRSATVRQPHPRTSPPTGPRASRQSGRRSAVRGRPTLQAEPPSPPPAAGDSTQSSQHPRRPAPVPRLLHPAARSTRSAHRSTPSLASAYSTRCAHDARGGSVAQVQYASPAGYREFGGPRRWERRIQQAGQPCSGRSQLGGFHSLRTSHTRWLSIPRARGLGNMAASRIAPTDGGLLFAA